MKTILSCTILLAFGAAPALAAPHCPPGQNNVWGACVDATPRMGHQGRGYHPGYDQRNYRREYNRNYSNGGHCPDGQLNVWGACVNRPGWGR